MDEPGRRIVKEELRGDGSALPWVDGAGFARRAIGVALADRDTASRLGGWVFFDRGLIDEARPFSISLANRVNHSGRSAPLPSARIHCAALAGNIVNDPERRHGFDDAVLEHDRLVGVYPFLGYEVVMLPKTGTPERADFVMHTLKT